VLHAFDPELLKAVLDLLIPAARLAHAGQIAFNVGHKYRNATLAKALGDTLQRYGLSCTRRTGDNTVAIGHVCEEVKLTLAVFRYQDRFCHKFMLPFDSFNK